jgi:hypothetical protein
MTAPRIDIRHQGLAIAALVLGTGLGCLLTTLFIDKITVFQNGIRNLNDNGLGYGISAGVVGLLGLLPSMIMARDVESRRAELAKGEPDEGKQTKLRRVKVAHILTNVLPGYFFASFVTLLCCSNADNLANTFWGGITMTGIGASPLVGAAFHTAVVRRRAKQHNATVGTNGSINQTFISGTKS